MKSWQQKLCVAIGTFGLGCSFYLQSGPLRMFAWRVVGPFQYCHIARNAAIYHNSNILVKARVIFDESGVYVYEDCDPTEALAASVVIDGNHPLIGPEYVEKLLVSGEQHQLKTAEVVIEGRFDAYATTGCWAPKFRIDAKRIELLSPVTDYTPPITEQEGLRLKH